ncbi:hypothetical protein OGAPHI_001011 [Ogataea philodendri]|uniref:Alpha-1,2-mannosyltransferase n=1 Tax=Ogataea philodendri TaxID=1378263 RepID=A0A9P8PEP3_9ASCO|nr:uncharacterized protein OGAPHI_001011 [Ogataea philodendri]KAH3670496.1 hypothetical protein OGAPHI_001011 [Ogataea philodendri]
MGPGTKHYRYYRNRAIAYWHHYPARVVILAVGLVALFGFLYTSSSSQIQQNIIPSNYTSFLNPFLSGKQDKGGKAGNRNPQEELQDRKAAKTNLYRQIFKIMEQNRPPVKLDNFEFDQAAHDTQDPFTSITLGKIGKFPHDFVSGVKSAHASFLKQMPEYDDVLRFNGNGVIILGGGDYSWLALLCTRMFRRMGGSLPVEVMLPRKADYLKDREICDIYLPQLNAKCVVMTEQLGITQQDEEELFFADFGVNYHMYRSLALLTSNYQNVLLLESETLLIKSLDESIFASEPFNTYGMVLWPDFWKRKTSPFWYLATDCSVDKTLVRDGILDLPESKQVSSSKADIQYPLHDRRGAIPDMSNDSGEMMINKKTHWKTLLLALYYNLYGDGYYYPLLTQSNSAGEKETFAAAATALKTPYYQTRTPTEANGFWYNDDFRGVGMLQFDPTVDFYSLNSFKEKYETNPDKLTEEELAKYLSDSPERKSALFFKVNYPRLLPIELIKDSFIVKENGDRIRMFGDNERFRSDLEVTLWRIMVDYICYSELHCSYLDKHFPPDRKYKETVAKYCTDSLKPHLLWLAGNH